MNRKQVIWFVVIAFFVGAAGSIILGRFGLPALSKVEGFGWVGDLTSSAPIIINRTEELHFNEGANLIELSKQAGNFTVSIFGANNNFLGNGVIITSDGLIFSSNIILAGQTQLTVLTNDGQKFQGTVRAKDPNSDLVVITIPATGLAVAQFEEAATLQPGQRLVYLGRGNTEFQHVFSTGFVSQTLNNIRSLQKVNSSAEFSEQVSSLVVMNQDMWGGPILNLNGKVVGLIIDNNRNIISENMQTALSAYLAAGKILRPHLGVRYLSLSKSLATILNLPSAGALVTAVDKASPAEKAGLLANDLITGIDGQNLAEQSLERVLNKHSISDMKVSILRAGKTFDLTIKLGER